MKPLQRLAQDLARVAAKRWVRAGLEEAFVWGRRAEPSAFDVLDWLRDRHRPGSGIYRYAVTFYAREAVPPRE